MTPLTYLPSFRGDLAEIWQHIAQDNRAAADQLVDDVWERCQMLSAHPQAGIVRADIAPDCRQLVLGAYSILYRIHDGQIELVRALHGRRKLSAELYRPDP